MSVRCLEQCQGQIGNPQMCALALVTVEVLSLSVSPKAQGKPSGCYNGENPSMANKL